MSNYGEMAQQMRQGSAELDNALPHLEKGHKNTKTISDEVLAQLDVIEGLQKFFGGLGQRIETQVTAPNNQALKKYRDAAGNIVPATQDSANEHAKAARIGATGLPKMVENIIDKGEYLAQDKLPEVSIILNSLAESVGVLSEVLGAAMLGAETIKQPTSGYVTHTGTSVAAQLYIEHIERSSGQGEA